MHILLLYIHVLYITVYQISDYTVQKLQFDWWVVKHSTEGRRDSNLILADSIAIA